MSTRPQQPTPPEGEGPPFGPRGPFSPADVQTVQTGVDVIRSLARMEKTVEILERVTDSHDERLRETIRQVDRMDVGLAVVRDGMALQGDRVRHLEKVSHFAGFVGAIMIGGGIVYVARLLYLLFSKGS